MNKPRVRRVSDTEVVIAAPRSVAFEHVADAMQKLGTVKQRDPDEAFIDGRIMCGFQSVAMRVSLVERDPGQTTVVIQASSDDAWGMGAKNASKRLVQTLENLDNPGFKPDRLGISPVAMVGIVIGLGVRHLVHHGATWNSLIHPMTPCFGVIVPSWMAKKSKAGAAYKWPRASGTVANAKSDERQWVIRNR